MTTIENSPQGINASMDAEEAKEHLAVLFSGLTSVNVYGVGGLQKGYNVNGHLVTEKGDYSGISEHGLDGVQLSAEEAAGILSKLAISKIFGEDGASLSDN